MSTTSTKHRGIAFEDRGDIDLDPTMSSGRKYRVQEVQITRYGRTELRYTVIEFFAGKALGGDHHWLSQEMAEYAQVLYVSGHEHLHGKSSRKVIEAMSKIFGENH